MEICDVTKSCIALELCKEISSPILIKTVSIGHGELQQKLVVRSCPVGNTKPISPIKPPNQSVAISVLPAKNPVPMVTAHSNGQKATSPEPPQTAPINLQTASKAGGRRVSETSSSQKLVVRSCPVGNTKPISHIKPPNQSVAISVLPAKNPVPMVTAHSNGQKAASPEPPQTAPINLQTASKAGGRRVSETSSSQVPRILSPFH
ncbi:UNVERIFIED_CONTAM: hypothetical protein FKN15_060422 [Acipenser sinensis]